MGWLGPTLTEPWSAGSGDAGLLHRGMSHVTTPSSSSSWRCGCHSSWLVATQMHLQGRIIGKARQQDPHPLHRATPTPRVSAAAYRDSQYRVSSCMQQRTLRGWQWICLVDAGSCSQTHEAVLLSMAFRALLRARGWVHRVARLHHLCACLQPGTPSPCAQAG
jgi:hypothetical protein